MRISPFSRAWVSAPDLESFDPLKRPSVETERAGITMRPLRGETPERAQHIRALALRFVFACYEEKKAAGVGAGGNDPKEIRDARAKTIVPG